ncbi:MAG: TIGR03943 family protein [Bacilli bacterium]|nr:TIGR03943 family protein [Bacilli bacterium]
MRKKFLGLICFLYALIIAFVWKYNILGNFLAPQMQIYLKTTLFVLLIIGIIICYSDKISYKFKITDLILILPLIALIFAGDGRLTTEFANNRNTNLKKETKATKRSAALDKFDVNMSDYNFDNVDFDIQDNLYYDLSNYITYITNPDDFVGKTIRVRGFTNTKGGYLPQGYFTIGKYGVSCCTADAGVVGFIAKYDKNKIKDNTWYEIDGVLQKTKDLAGYDIMVIIINSYKEIDYKKEEQYVYPCYSYDDNSCDQLLKYNFK